VLVRGTNKKEYDATHGDAVREDAIKDLAAFPPPSYDADVVLEVPSSNDAICSPQLSTLGILPRSNFEAKRLHDP
jgi:hypothetical protein